MHGNIMGYGREKLSTHFDPGKNAGKPESRAPEAFDRYPHTVNAKKKKVLNVKSEGGKGGNTETEIQCKGREEALFRERGARLSAQGGKAEYRFSEKDGGIGRLRPSRLWPKERDFKTFLPRKGKGVSATIPKAKESQREEKGFANMSMKRGGDQRER